MINTGALFISNDEIVMIDDDFIQADSTQNTINQGTLLISGTLRFVDGVIDEVGGLLHGGWLRQLGTTSARPNFHTIFLPQARSENPSAVLDDGDTDTLINGPVRRAGGGDFVFPTGDVRGEQVYRGLVGLSAPTTASDVDAHYFWRDGLTDFGTQLDTLLLQITDREYWRVWGEDALTLSPMYEASSRIDDLLLATPGLSMENLTLAGWDGTQWVDLGGQAGNLSTPASGFVSVQLDQPRAFLALTFAVRLLADEDSDGDGVPNDKEWDANGDGQGPDDTDRDGTPDYLDPDDDNDGFLTRNEDWDQSGTPCDDDRDGDGTPDYLDPEAGDALRLWVTKTVNLEALSVGDSVRWTLTVQNRSTIPVVATLFDVMPAGLALNPDILLAGSGGRVGAPEQAVPDALLHPALEAQGILLHWPDLQLMPGETHELEFRTEATIGLNAGDHHNFAFATTGTGPARVFSNLATASFSLHEDQQLDCATVIGRVFNDKDVDGELDPFEPGIAGVRIGEHSGLLIRTDDQGRFHLPCELVRHDFGKNLVLKLDKRTLPAGFEMTSENPRAIRLTRGKMVKANFGASLSREVTLNISDCTFENKGQRDGFHPSWRQVLTQIIELLEQGPSRLVIDYTGGPDLQKEELSSRFEMVEAAVSAAWKAKPRRYHLSTSIRSRRFIGTAQLPCERFKTPPPQFEAPYSKADQTPTASRWTAPGIKPARETRFFAATDNKSR